MTIKQLEQRIEKLEAELADLRSQMLSLALRPSPSYPVYIPVPPLPQPVYVQPRIVPWQEPHYPIIICTTGGVQ